MKPQGSDEKGLFLTCTNSVQVNESPEHVNAYRNFLLFLEGRGQGQGLLQPKLALNQQWSYLSFPRRSVQVPSIL